MRRILPAVLLLAAAWTAFGQSAPASPAFEVASVKHAAPADPGGSRRSFSKDPGRLTYEHVTLRSLLMTAYKMKDYQVSGPAWLGQERYDVAARIPGNTPEEQAPLMLQALLAERFHLALHHEQKELPSYALAAARGGFKLQAQAFQFTAQGDAIPPGKKPDEGAPAGPSLFAAVQTVGLRLEPRKTSFDILVIDRAEKIPTEN